MRIILLFMSLTIFTSCDKQDSNNDTLPDYRSFSSMAEFNNLLLQLVSDPDKTRLTAFYDSLKANHQIPFILDDSVAFLYMGNAEKVQWAGDFNGWDPGLTGYNGKNLGNGLWIIKQSFPIDARLDYKIVLNGNQWILDPANKYIQYSGFGPNSELRMPDWVEPQETILSSDVQRGKLGSNQIIQSSQATLGYKVQYRVYTPYNYSTSTELPTVYVTDGHEYSDDRLGAMVIILDNLIYKQIIKPLVVVFIDPRNPDNLSENRRMMEYAGNIRFANFVADELVPTIDSAYKTIATPEMRCIMGTSMGGWNAAFFGLKRYDTFGNLAIHSPAFDNSVIAGYQNAEKLPLKVFMSTGIINDTEDRARQMNEILKDKGYPLMYIEVNQGHSWGNWRALIDDPMQYFFSVTETR